MKNSELHANSKAPDTNRNKNEKQSPGKKQDTYRHKENNRSGKHIPEKKSSH